MEKFVIPSAAKESHNSLNSKGLLRRLDKSGLLAMTAEVSTYGFSARD